MTFPVVSVELTRLHVVCCDTAEEELPLKVGNQPGELDQSEGGSACQLRHHGEEEGSNIPSRKLPLIYRN